MWTNTPITQTILWIQSVFVSLAISYITQDDGSNFTLENGDYFSLENQSSTNAVTPWADTPATLNNWR